MNASMRTIIFVLTLLLCCSAHTKGACVSQSDIVFVVDHSGSITDNNPTNGSWDNWILMKEFMVKVVEKADISYDGIHVGLVTFGNVGLVRFKLTDFLNKANVEGAIKALPSGNGETNLYAGLVKMRTVFKENMGGRPWVKKLAIILTDGKANVNVDRTESEASAAYLQDGIHIMMIGITADVDVKQLKSISSPPHRFQENYWTSPDFKSLSTVLNSVQTKTCNQDKIVYDACYEREVVFAFTFPSDVTKWNYMKGFLIAFIQNYLPIDANGVRVSVVTFDYNKVTVQFGLDRYSSESDLKAAIDSLPFKAGTIGNPALLMNQINNLQFRNSRDVQKTLVLFIGYRLRNPDAVVQAAYDLALQGIGIVAIDVVSETKLSLLRDIGSRLQNNIQTIDYKYLQGKLNQLGSVICGAQSEVSCPRKADLVFVLDQSTSIAAASGGNKNWETIKTFAASIADSFPVSSDLTRIGLLKFSTQASTRGKFFLNSFFTNSQIKTSILNLVMEGGETNIADALRQARAMFAPGVGGRANVPHIIILLTDGQSNRESDQTIDEANAAKAANISIYTIGVTNQVNVVQLKNIASSPYETHYFFADDFDKLNTIILDLVEKSCSSAQTLPTTTRRPTTTTTSTTTTSATTTTTSTKPTTTTSAKPTTTTSTTTTTTIKTTTTTFLPTLDPVPTSNCAKKADVVFIIHKSTNMRVDYYKNYVIQLIKDSCSKFNIDNKDTQISVITFSTDAVVEFYLNNFTSGAAVINSIEKISHEGYGTNLAAALALARTSIFTKETGARINDPTVSKVAIVILNYKTDSQTNALREAENLKQLGVRIFSVGTGTILNIYELAAMANYPVTNNMRTVTSARDLHTLAEPLKRFACSDDINCITSPCTNGASCIDIGNQVICNCRPGNTGANCNLACQNGVDVVFIMDTSRGIGMLNFLKVINFVYHVIQNLDIDTSTNGASISRVGLMTYDGSGARVQFNLNRYTTKVSLLLALSVPFNAGDNRGLKAALELAMNTMFTPQNGDRPDKPNHIVVLSDGDYPDNENYLLELWKTSMNVRNRNIFIQAVALERNFYIAPQLEAICSNGAINVVYSQGFDNLNSDVQFVSDRLCSNRNYCAQSPCFNGASCKADLGTYKCGPCPPGTSGYNCQRTCTGEIDLTIMLSSSALVHRERFPFLQAFASSIVDALDISDTKTRVALIYWAETAKVAFYLNSYYNKHDIKQAILLETSYMGGGSNISGALRLLRRSVLTPQSGERPNSKNIVIMITNGPSSVDQELTVPEAVQVRIEGTLIIPIALETHMNSSIEMWSIASNPKLANLLKIEYFRNIPSKIPNVLRAICNDFNECSVNNCNGRGTCVDKYHTYQCNCNPPNTGENCQQVFTKQVDVVIVLDVSGSLEEDYKRSLLLVKEIIYGLPMENDVARVGLISFSTNLLVQIFLDQNIRNKYRFIDMVDFYRIIGRTNTPSAFDALLNNQLGRKGDRPNVPNYVVVISDGFSNINPSQTVPKAVDIKNRGNAMIAVAMGNAPNLSELRGIASSESYILYSSSSSTPAQVANDVLNKIKLPFSN